MTSRWQRKWWSQANNEPSCLSNAILHSKRSTVCFSYAAYVKNLICYLENSDIPVEAGLSEAEFSTVESSYGFTFPPDLSSILQEGLPVGTGFPNWRSSSNQQLDVRVNQPIMGICKEVSRNEFWDESWGEKPDCGDRAVNLARELVKKAPILVPIYRDFYIPSTPCTAGNPVFCVRGSEVSLRSYDLAGFFNQVEFNIGDGEAAVRRHSRPSILTVPAWAATEGRRIEFWTAVAEGGGREEARCTTRRWWDGDFGECMEEVCWRLRDAGWKEEDVRDMMRIDGCN